jgi:esterase FrsA
MSYEYDTDLKALWSERAPQFVNLGIPQEDVDHLVAVVDDLYADRPGGWCYEWSKLAEKYIDAGDAVLAFTAYGGARFPCLADEQKAVAHQHELEQYQLAAKEFPVAFERQIVTTRFHGAVVEVPVHILSEPDATKDTPVLVVTGGVDTWKMDLHKMWVSYVLNAHVRVVAADHPGTGELTHVAMTADSTDVIDQVVAFARTLTTGKVGQLGMSFGGHFSSHAGLTAVVDAAVDVGGPVLNTFAAENIGNILYGMKDIVGNALGFTEVPTTDQVAQALAPFAMDDLFAKQTNCPMFVINGDKDAYIPLSDTKIFEGRPNTEVQIVPGAGHCAFDKLDLVIDATTRWLVTALH